MAFKFTHLKNERLRTDRKTSCHRHLLQADPNGRGLSCPVSRASAGPALPELGAPACALANFQGSTLTTLNLEHIEPRTGLPHRQKGTITPTGHLSLRLVLMDRHRKMRRLLPGAGCEFLKSFVYQFSILPSFSYHSAFLSYTILRIFPLIYNLDAL